MLRIWCCAVGVLAIVCGTADAATIPATCVGTTGSPGSLIAAIGQANGLTGADTIELGAGCTYGLTAVDNSWYGHNGLPPISSDITIDGNGATIARATPTPFRLFFVSADRANANTLNYVSPGPGRLTLRNVTLKAGFARGGDSNGGGGGAGMGGAIFSQGAVVIDHSTLMSNTAQGGLANDAADGVAGGGIGTSSTGGDGGGFGAGSFGGGFGGSGSEDLGAGGGAGFALGENGGSASVTPTPGGAGSGGGPRTGLGGSGGVGFNTHVGIGGDGSGGGGTSHGLGQHELGGAFGEGGQLATQPGDLAAGSGGGVGGGGGAGDRDGGGGGGFGGGGGGSLQQQGGDGGFGGGGGGGLQGPGAPGFGGGIAVAAASGGGAGMGGAIFNMQGTLVIVDSTIANDGALGGSDTVAGGKGIGGAVFNLNGSFTATGSTFAGNTGDDDAAQIFNLVYDGHTARTAQTTLRDTIVAAGIGPADLASVKTAAIVPSPLGTANADVSQFDLVRQLAPSAVDEMGTVTGSPLTADPLLGPLQDNGGRTLTMMPGAGSPAIDAGDPGCNQADGTPLGTDQRGHLRPAGAACDLGAVELSRPGAQTGPATDIGLTNATLTGLAANPDVAAASAHFEYGPTTAYGSSTDAQPVGPVTGQGAAQAEVTGLAPATTYHFRLVVTNAFTTQAGADGVLTTASPGPGAGAAPSPPAVTKLTLSPTAFVAASSGGSAVAAKVKPKVRAKVKTGTKVSFTLSEAGTVRFTVTEPAPGRKSKARRCVAQTKTNRHAAKCTRVVTLKRSFTRTGRAGANRFRFTGRLSGRKLKARGYHLVATPTAAGKTGKPRTAAFRIKVLPIR